MINSDVKIESRLLPFFRGPVFAFVQFGIILFVGILLFRSHPVEYRFIPSCPTAALRGVYCPGCGSTRAVHFLLNADIAAAWRHNPLFVILGIPVFVLYLRGLFYQAIGKCFRFPALSAAVVKFIALAVILYFIARNLPQPIFDQLRPPPIADPRSVRSTPE